MPELNKYEQAALDNLGYQLDYIQEFIDKNIHGTNRMSAKVIFEKFSQEYKNDETEEDFIKGLRAAIKSGQITGITSAGRYGYKRIGENVSTAESPLKILEPYLEKINNFVEKNIQGDTKMTSGQVFKTFSEEFGCDLSEDEFTNAFRYAVRSNIIKGLTSAGPYGYRRVNGEFDSEDLSFVDRSQDITVVYLSDKRRIISLDKFNWAYQTRGNGITWVTQGYYYSFKNTIESLSKKIIDSELNSVKEGVSLEEMVEKIEAAEQRVCTLLNKIIRGEEVEVKTEKADKESDDEDAA